MDKWQCVHCGYIYDPQPGDPDNNIKPKTPFANLSKRWKCPVCGAKKSRFEPYDEEEKE